MKSQNFKNMFFLFFCSFGMFDMSIQYVLDGLKATAKKSQKKHSTVPSL